MKYNTYIGNSIQQHKNKIKSSGQLLWPTASMLINKVNNDACQWNGFFIDHFICCMTKKSWAFSDLVAAISASLHETFVRSKYAKSVSQFLLIIYKYFVGQLKVFLPSFCHYCACEMSPGCGGIWSPEWTLVWGIWTVFWPGVGGNLNNNFQNSQINARGVAQGGHVEASIWPIHKWRH